MAITLTSETPIDHDIANTRPGTPTAMNTFGSALAAPDYLEPTPEELEEAWQNLMARAPATFIALSPAADSPVQARVRAASTV